MQCYSYSFIQFVNTQIRKMVHIQKNTSYLQKEMDKDVLYHFLT